MSLDAKDRAALRFMHYETCRDSQGYMCDCDLTEAVEQIVARHVAAALTEAADALERKSIEAWETYADSDFATDYGRWDAWRAAAAIVRNLAKPT